MLTNILGIESSCDETAAAVVRNGREKLSNIVASQINTHRKFGGVVPEIASRKHIESVISVIDEAINFSSLQLGDIDGIAVTQGPGLIGSLMVGLSVAKGLAYSLDVPMINVDHLEAHISVIHLEFEVSFPFVALIVSGGHTNLYYVNGYTDFELIGRTRDDAAGEAFDKAAKILGLGYPGGIEIDRISRKGDPESINFPRSLLDKNKFDFSYSGLKTSLLYYIRDNPVKDDQELADICASYQEAIVDTLISKTLSASRKYGVKGVVISGGVACNSRLRKLAGDVFREEGMDLHIPSPEFCTDNAAMIAALGYYRLKDGDISTLDISTYSTARV